MNAEHERKAKAGEPALTPKEVAEGLSQTLVISVSFLAIRWRRPNCLVLSREMTVTAELRMAGSPPDPSETAYSYTSAMFLRAFLKRRMKRFSKRFDRWGMLLIKRALSASFAGRAHGDIRWLSILGGAGYGDAQAALV
jgi:hypothetical protein